MLSFTQVPGANKGKIRLYALSTCVWCKKTKRLLDELGVEYYYLDLDLLSGPVGQEAETELKKWNPQCSFPTLVLNDQQCIVGFDETELRAVLR